MKDGEIMFVYLFTNSKQHTNTNVQLVVQMVTTKLKGVKKYVDT
jgi:hypothetical protein